MNAVPPGFVDLQVNGYLGVDFSDPALTRESFVKAAAGVLQRGACVAFLPTIITSPLETYTSNLPLLADVIESTMPRSSRVGESPTVLLPRLPPDSILGIHLEGPFISPEPGAVGCHPPEHTRAPSVAELREWQTLARGHIKLLTIAAELDGAEELCRAATQEMGIAASLGHQLAGGEDVRRLVNAGATLCTHLGNGMPNMIHRHQNSLWASLADDRLSTMLITDGEHLPADAITTFVRAKRAARIIVTSDVAPVAGLAPGVYAWGSTMVRVEDTRVRAADLPCLAGSGSLMLHCMNHLASIRQDGGGNSGGGWLMTREELGRVGFDNPLKVIGVGVETVQRLRGQSALVRFEEGSGSSSRRFERVPSSK